MSVSDVWGHVSIMGGEKAVKGSSIAAVKGDAIEVHHSRIFYQDPELRLREYVFDYPAKGWVKGE